MVKIYFCGSIRGGRELAVTYSKLIQMLKAYGEVLTEHIGLESVIRAEAATYSDKEIFARDIRWLEESDVVIAEVTAPSLGVGYEIGHAVKIGKPILCLFNIKLEKTLSAMISGCPDITLIKYTRTEELNKPVGKFINQHAARQTS